jgi:hypothetical protein
VAWRPPPGCVFPGFLLLVSVVASGSSSLRLPLGRSLDLAVLFLGTACLLLSCSSVHPLQHNTDRVSVAPFHSRDSFFFILLALSRPVVSRYSPAYTRYSTYFCTAVLFLFPLAAPHFLREMKTFAANHGGHFSFSFTNPGRVRVSQGGCWPNYPRGLRGWAFLPLRAPSGLIVPSRGTVGVLALSPSRRRNSRGVDVTRATHWALPLRDGSRPARVSMYVYSVTAFQ